MSDEAHNFLVGGGGAPIVSFDNVNDKVVGRILKHELMQQRDFATKKPKTWDDGSPMMQAVVTLQAEEFAPLDEDDDGQRRLFVKGQMQKAVREAIHASGHNPKASIIGGRLGVVFVAEEDTGRGNPRKVFRAKFEPPAAIPERDEPEYEPGSEPF